ncbi:hypothetical protein VNI00_012368 [Paramarasmius palmivorus]|uniref:Major facilitator superfamily (MFS) profile domain-containing protein n=1 Tax=Paramarasmius palmivorus TaxID=297713 RepID=A0AAW0C5B1_9AGAR
MPVVQSLGERNNDSEKKATIIVEHNTGQLEDAREDALPVSGTPERLTAETKLVRKLDMRVLPVIVVIYIMNYIDRVAIATARLQGLEEDLKLSDIQYEVVLSILYVTYSPAQIPSNMALNYVTRPSLYIGMCVVAWGLISAMTGVTHNFGGILACRMFMGLPEELAFRSAIMFVGLMVANAFGALMAAGILAKMEGKQGIRAWRWLFFIEGAITIFIGLLSMWLLPDYPDNTRWLTASDCRLAQARIADDAGEADKDNEGDSPLRGLKQALTDRKVLIFSVMDAAQLFGLNFADADPGFQYYNIIGPSGPPWILGSFVLCLSAWHADRTGERFFHIAGWMWSVMVGFIIALSTMNTVARYISMILMAFGYAGQAMTLVWVSNTIPRPPAKRAAALGIVNGVAALGSLIGSFVWKEQWAPKYKQSMIISLCPLVFSSSLALILRQMLLKENRKLDEDERRAIQGADRARVEQAAKLEGITFDQAMERRKGFRYLY